MSLDLEGFLANVKRAALEAVLAAKPFSLTYGTVAGTSPLSITVDQKLTLCAEQLILTNAVRNYSTDVTIDFETGRALDGVDLSHTHDYSGKTSLPIAESETAPPLNDDTGPAEGGAEVVPVADNHTHDYLGITENGGAANIAHTHMCKGEMRLTFRLALKKGERVLLLRADGGQKYIILDRVEAPA